jgi:replicative DNA helicase
MSETNAALPPHSLEAEMAVLGSMLVERDAVVKAIDILKPADFYKETHRLIFETILKLHNICLLKF